MATFSATVLRSPGRGPPAASAGSPPRDARQPAYPLVRGAHRSDGVLARPMRAPIVFGNDRPARSLSTASRSCAWLEFADDHRVPVGLRDNASPLPLLACRHDCIFPPWDGTSAHPTDQANLEERAIRRPRLAVRPQIRWVPGGLCHVEQDHGRFISRNGNVLSRGDGSAIRWRPPRRRRGGNRRRAEPAITWAIPLFTSASTCSRTCRMIAATAVARSLIGSNHPLRRTATAKSNGLR